MAVAAGTGVAVGVAVCVAVAVGTGVAVGVAVCVAVAVGTGVAVDVAVCVAVAVGTGEGVGVGIGCGVGVTAAAIGVGSAVGALVGACVGTGSSEQAASSMARSVTMATRIMLIPDIVFPPDAVPGLCRRPFFAFQNPLGFAASPNPAGKPSRCLALDTALGENMTGAQRVRHGGRPGFRYLVEPVGPTKVITALMVTRPSSTATP